MTERKNKPTVFMKNTFMQRLIIKFPYIWEQWYNSNGRVQSDISSDQEEADTKMFLCAKYCVLLGVSSICIHTVDADVLVLPFYYSAHANNHLLTLNLPNI